MGHRRRLPPSPGLARQRPQDASGDQPFGRADAPRGHRCAHQRALAHHRVDPSLLTCEITESVAMEDTKATRTTFRELGAAGIHLSIDDFGTGYSSLAYLCKLPAEELKIDRSFVMDVELAPTPERWSTRWSNWRTAGPAGCGGGRRERASTATPGATRVRRTAGLFVRQTDDGASPSALGDGRPQGGGAELCEFIARRQSWGKTHGFDATRSNPRAFAETAKQPLHIEDLMH